MQLLCGRGRCRRRSRSGFFLRSRSRGRSALAPLALRCLERRRRLRLDRLSYLLGRGTCCCRSSGLRTLCLRKHVRTTRRSRAKRRRSLLVRLRLLLYRLRRCSKTGQSGARSWAHCCKRCGGCRRVSDARTGSGSLCCIRLRCHRRDGRAPACGCTGPATPGVAALRVDCGLQPLETVEGGELHLGARSRVLGWVYRRWSSSLVPVREVDKVRRV